ncbi:hypothetical protein Q3G72_009457 [Acer saccharum]|nr:hypothetical protein Q3G72_009457 [Acer saccharum]
MLSLEECIEGSNSIGAIGEKFPKARQGEVSNPNGARKCTYRSLECELKEEDEKEVHEEEVVKENNDLITLSVDLVMKLAHKEAEAKVKENKEEYRRTYSVQCEEHMGKGILFKTQSDNSTNIFTARHVLQY